MKTVIVCAVACMGAAAAWAADAQPELTEQTAGGTNWRLTVGGFGRGSMRASLPGLGSDRMTAYGADLDVQYRVWGNARFDVWAGIGGTFCPRQDATSGRSARTQTDHQVSADGYTTYDFSFSERANTRVDLAYGEFRMLLVPEWKVTERLSLGTRLGVAFDWVIAHASSRRDWRWNSTFTFDIPGMEPTVDRDGDSGSTHGSDSQTEFAAQAIMGLQATYMFTDHIGAYANVDYRCGSDVDFRFASLDLDGWYAGVGVTVAF